MTKNETSSPLQTGDLVRKSKTGAAIYQVTEARDDAGRLLVRVRKTDSPNSKGGLWYPAAKLFPVR